jgi:BioD-like phosphotransacetylase family protein
VRRQLDDSGWPLLGIIAEDRSLHAPSIADVAEATGAKVLIGEAREDMIAEHIVVAPVSVDPAYHHFRKYPHKLVIARSDKTELQIASLSTSTNALLLTGGMMPGVYTFDRVSNERVPLLLAPGETVEVIQQIEAAFTSARFHSPRKLERLEEVAKTALTLEPLRLPAATGG